jgi:hypothetical protein
MKIDRCPITSEERKNMVAREAYARFERRGGRAGDPAEDWREAEAEIEAQLKKHCGPEPRRLRFPPSPGMFWQIRRILRPEDGSGREAAVRESLGRAIEKTREVGQAIPAALDGAGKQARRRVDAACENLGRKVRTLWLRRNELTDTLGRRSARFIDHASKRIKDLAARNRRRDT